MLQTVHAHSNSLEFKNNNALASLVQYTQIPKISAIYEITPMPKLLMEKLLCCSCSLLVESLGLLLLPQRGKRVVFAATTQKRLEEKGSDVAMASDGL